MKAKKVDTIYGKYSNTVVYEYRGHEYEVEYANDFSYCVSPAWVQHRDAQAEIDKAIESDQRPHDNARPAQEGFDLFWEYVNQE